jgi:predicted DNA-binding antitoxin AbrB/MazE fold protein
MDAMSLSHQFSAIYEDGVLKTLEPLNLAEHQRVRVSVTSTEIAEPSEGSKRESFYEAAARLGFIGCIEGTPADLSTNKKYTQRISSDHETPRFNKR